MRTSRFNEYQVMWIMVMFDLPTETKKEQKAAALFRKRIMQDGFTMFQFSIYLRHCPTWANAQVHIKRVKSFLPPLGYVCILTITDKQFGLMELFHSRKEAQKKTGPQQLEFW